MREVNSALRISAPMLFHGLEVPAVFESGGIEI